MQAARVRRLSLLGVGLLVGSTIGSATATDGPLFAAPFLSFDTGPAPNSVVIGDLNGDGKPDLATANATSNTVSVLLGDGDGNFEEKTDFGTGMFPRSLAIGDLNGDGKPDLATANATSTTVSVLLGNGDGSFRVKSDFGTGDYPTSVAIGDLNSDGKLDVVTANYSTRTVSVLLNIGAGPNAGPDCEAATSVVPELWPPNHRMIEVGITGINDPDGDTVTITAIGVTQDEPVSGRGTGNTSPDARIANGVAQVRAERANVGNGRVYRITFLAQDGRGARCEGAVEVCAPHDARPGRSCVNDGQSYDSLVGAERSAHASRSVSAR
jgi:hypothetical protein